LNYTLSEGSSFGVLTHFWTAGDPGRISFILFRIIYLCCFLEIDESIFSYYIDGESVPSIQFVTHMLAGAVDLTIKLPHGKQNGLVKEQRTVVGTIICKFNERLSFFFCQNFISIYSRVPFQNQFV
jgi:hypothetical protein